jgi:hypothetical protein
MEEQEILEIDIGDLRHAYQKMQEVLNDLKDVDGLDDDYIELNEIAERINDLRIDKEVKLERLEELTYV